MDEIMDKTPEQFAQWVINNRFNRCEGDKISDFEMYHIIIDKIKKHEQNSI